MAEENEKSDQPESKIEPWGVNLNVAGTIESYGAQFLSGLCMLILLGLGSLFFFYALDINEESAKQVFRSMMSENFGVYSFVSASLLTIVGNSLHLISTPKYVGFTEIFRLNVQSYLVGLFSTVFAVGYCGLDILEFKDLFWTLGILTLVMVVTALSTVLKNRLPRKNQIILGSIYIAIFVITLSCFKNIFNLIIHITS